LLSWWGTSKLHYLSLTYVLAGWVACSPALQDLVSCADSPDNPLPDPACLHLSINTAALTELRTMKQKQLQAGSSQAPTIDSAAAAAAVLGTASAAATGGLWGCAAEWAGLSCRHSGSWQLSLLYDPDELAQFSLVSYSTCGMRLSLRRNLTAYQQGRRHQAPLPCLQAQLLLHPQLTRAPPLCQHAAVPSHDHHQQK
jgi:hypothetical protein